MANLNDRLKKEKTATPTAKAVEQITGIKKKDKYTVTIVFDAELEEKIKERAKGDYGLGVATYIKMLVTKDLNN